MSVPIFMSRLISAAYWSMAVLKKRVCRSRTSSTVRQRNISAWDSKPDESLRDELRNLSLSLG